MVKYIKLVLEGFGCFGGRAEFVFEGGLDVFTQPNEKGKSTMLNGIVHTLFGMKKADKDRFRSWAAPASFTGELTLDADGIEYVIKMDFDDDKVQVKRIDESTGRPTEHLRAQSHVPAGKNSEKYNLFLQEVLGTSDIDVFKSAFVVEQPLKDVLELGEGGELILVEAGGLYTWAIKKLVDRLGKEASGITMNIQDYDVESSKQRKPRELELLQDELYAKQGELARSEEALNQIFPLMEEQKKAASEIARLKEAASDNEARKVKAERWIKLREDYVRLNRTSGDKRDYYSKVSSKLDEQKGLEADLHSIRAGFVGEPVQDALIEAVKSASETAKALLVKADGIKRQYAGSTGLGGSIGEVDLLSADAEMELETLAERAGKESSSISAAMAGLAEWDKSFGGIKGATDQKREEWLKELAELEELPRKRAEIEKNWKTLTTRKYFYRIMLHVATWVAAIWWIVAGQNPYGYILLGFSVALLVASYFNRPGAIGKRTTPPDIEANIEQLEAAADQAEKDALKGRIALFDLMKSRPAPYVPEGAERLIKNLDAVEKDATELIRISAGIRQALASVDEDDISAIYELANLTFPRGRSALLGITEELLNKAGSENEKRKAHAESVSGLETAISKASSIVKEMLHAVRAESLEGLRADSETAEREASFTFAQWRTEFEGDLVLKPDTEIEVLRDVQGELARLKENEAKLQLSLNDANNDLDKVKDRLRDANADKIGNIPELYEQIESLKGRISELLFEAEAIKRAIEQLRIAGESFGEATCDSLKQSITSMLEKVTGVSGRNVKVAKGFTLDVEADGRGVSYDQLSQGTKDQLYICMRIAAAELLGEGRNLPMFFDDSFGTTDKARLEEIRKLMTDMSKGRQFIILSHSDDISSWGTQIGTNPVI